MVTESHSDWMKIVNAAYDGLPSAADVFLCHGWGDLHDQTLEYIGQMYAILKPKYVVLNSLSEYQIGSPGFSYWKDKLVNSHKVPESSVVGAGEGRHTLEEAGLFADFMQAHHLTSATVISTPMHIARAYLTNLGVALERGSAIRFYPRTFTGVNWEEFVHIAGYLEQTGGDVTTRLGRFAAEFARIAQYRDEYQQGNKDFIIASVSEGLEYLEKNT